MDDNSQILTEIEMSSFLPSTSEYLTYTDAKNFNFLYVVMEKVSKARNLFDSYLQLKYTYYLKKIKRPKSIIKIALNITRQNYRPFWLFLMLIYFINFGDALQNNLPAPVDPSILAIFSDLYDGKEVQLEKMVIHLSCKKNLFLNTVYLVSLSRLI